MKGTKTHRSDPSGKAKIDHACNEASIGACLANCVALCKGLDDSGETSPELGETPARFLVRTSAARRLIFNSGERSEGIPIICSGWAATVAVLPNNRRQIISILLPGDIVSNALAFENKLTLTVEAITDVVYHSFERDQFLAAVTADANLFGKILKSWAEENQQVVRLAISLGQLTAEERIAQLLLNLSERLASRRLIENHTFHFPLRHRHIAEATGLTPVHVSRVIGQLRREGIIELEKRSLKIRNLEMLQRLCRV
jgi:CRP-like cAMP-binding protein